MTKMQAVLLALALAACARVAARHDHQDLSKAPELTDSPLTVTPLSTSPPHKAQGLDHWAQGAWTLPAVKHGR